MPSPYCPFMSLTGREHDTFLCRIACKKARIWTFFWLDQENNMDDLRCSDWPKMPPSVSCWFQSAFLLAKWGVNTHASSFWNFCRLSFLEFEKCLIEISSIEIFSISSYIKKLQSKIHRSFECNLIPATSYRGDKRVHFSNNQFMNGILTWFDCNSSFRNLRIILSDLRFHNTFQFVKYGTSAYFFFTAFGTERSQRAFASKFFIICSC